MTDHTYTVRWGDKATGEMFECRNLDPRTALARIRNALRERGPIVIASVERERPE